MGKYEEFLQLAEDAKQQKGNVECARLSRRALETGIEYLYEKLDKKLPERASLLELVDSSVMLSFLKDPDLVSSMHYIRMLGMDAEHDKKIKAKEAKLTIENLVVFVELIIALHDGKPVKPQKLPYMSEANTRKIYIDHYLAEAGWEVLDTENLAISGKAGIEIKVLGMPNPQGFGFCDYVLYGADGKPLAIVEAKKTSVDANKGKHQVELYGECMKQIWGYVPVLYYTNGYSIHVMDGLYPDREVYAFHTMKELDDMLQRRSRGDITNFKVNDDISGRPYQKMAITNLCEHFNGKHRRGLIVMATGTGKTRVAVSLVDVLTKNNWITRVLFLADRTSLVAQAKNAFKKLLPDMSYCVLSDKGEKDMNARLMFSTYQTMINYIDAEDKRFSSGRFDLIIIDEAHRSIFNKYSSIFMYFDSLLVGLTATPKDEIDANTYRVFGCEQDKPNFEYGLKQAVADKYLVDYKAVSHTTKLLKQGKKYKDLSEDEKEQLAEYEFEDDGSDLLIAKNDIFKVLYNEATCRMVLEELMEKGIKVDDGEVLGKTIIFAYNHHHATMIVKCFNEMYPELGDDYCKLIDNQVTYADDLIVRFGEQPNFRIAVSVDMLDTGIDVPAVLNLVFFKVVKSPIKFAQMIGRGTRLCEDLFGPGRHKQYFQIFDYCGNFEYFEQNPDGTDGYKALSMSQRLFELRLDILTELQKAEYQSDELCAAYYEELKNILQDQVALIKSHNDRIQVRAEMAYVDKYFDDKTWDYISPIMNKEIKIHLTPLLDSGLNGEAISVAFDIKMLNVELSVIMVGGISRAVKSVQIIRAVADYLLTKASVPAIKNKIPQLQTLSSEQFWSSPKVDKMEQLRKDVRDLMQYLDSHSKKKIDVNIQDQWESEGVDVHINVDIRTYREKVLDYLAEHLDSPVISKIKNLEKINADDLRELEEIMWSELGTKEDYDKLTNIDNLAAFVRSLVGVSQEVINARFGQFLDDNSLNTQQQEFVQAIINYVRENGDIQREDLVESSPFDNVFFVELFGEKRKLVLDMVDWFHNSIAPEVA
ncbi:MAG: DEAD/DEAH box helicase family protein [Lachnospiraceae bacterium]|nr:DEAD/DEAH box helicase family protein [Lachnospiraceae bacterium]